MTELLTPAAITAALTAVFVISFFKGCRVTVEVQQR